MEQETKWTTEDIREAEHEAREASIGPIERRVRQKMREVAERATSLEWGGEAQIEAENEFWALAECLGIDFHEAQDRCHKATLEERIAIGWELVEEAAS